MSFTKDQSKKIHPSQLEEWYPGKWSMDLDELVSKHLIMTNKLAGSMRKHVKRKKSKELKEVREARKEHSVVMKRLRERYRTPKSA